MIRNCLFMHRYLPHLPISRSYPAVAKHSGAKMKEILQERFPSAKTIDVVDISGGCGAMFEVVVETPEFQGLNTVKQHRLINEALKEQIKNMHGIRIHTSVPTNK